MIWHTLSAEDALKKLASDKSNGLTSDEAEERLNKDGKNEITDSKKESIVKKFLEQFNDYMIIILLIAAAISFVIALYERNNDFIEPIVIISIVFLNALIGTIQEEKAEKSLLALKKMTRPTACVIRNGLPSTVNASDIVCGDIIKLKAGDFVPADARIISCNNLCTDESSLTGESYSILKDANKILKADTPISDMKNMVWSSTAITGGNCTAVVTNTGMDTQVGKIAKAIIESKTPPTPLQVKLESTGKILGTIALIICALVFATGIFKNIPPIEMFMTSVSLAVAAIPEGLPAIVTVMLAIGVQKMAYKNAIVRKLPTVETLGSASVICSDKTGTITQNKMTVTNVFGNENEVISKACLCSNNTDSTERAIIEYANVNHIDIPEYKRVKEIPFNSSTKYMMTVHKYENKYISVVKGAFDILIDKFALSESEHKIHIAKMTEMTNNGLRVISVGYFISSGIPSGIDKPLSFCGLIGLSDPPRPEIFQAIKSCKKAGIKPVMITGDHAGTASAIAKQIGMPCHVITGAELNKMSDSKLCSVVKSTSVFARVTPEHKVRIIKAFQSNGEVVAMTGDGINDAPALKQADIGCAMGITGTDVAKGASDMILTDDNFATIVEAVREGRSIFANIRKSVHFLLSSNIGEILTIFCAIIAGLPSPLNAVQLLWVNLITDSLPAIALGADGNNKDKIMSQKPVRKNKSLFADGLSTTIFLEGILIGTLALTGFCIGYYKFSSYEAGNTMAFCVLSISQLIHTYNVRSDESVFKANIPPNRLLNASLLISISLQIFVVLSPALSKWFCTVSLNTQQWKIVAVLSVIPIAAVEISKFVFSRQKPI